ncbi:UNVERIFIED_CONTAM: hypothetical protein HDU68_002630 [Siphonaria sp. JEL0065]|nr:hypothetical protein HDU68_002630 [Siphonaria sp. JEL0065]
MTRRNIDMDALIADLDSSLSGVSASATATTMPTTVGDLLADTSALSGFLNIVPPAAIRQTELPWVRRFFVLSKDRICQFASSSPSEFVLDELVLGKSSLVSNDSQRAGNPLAFEVFGSAGKMWILSATSKVSKETWIDMISLLISRSSESARPMASPGRSTSSSNNPVAARRGDSDTIRSAEDVYGKSPRRTETVRSVDSGSGYGGSARGVDPQDRVNLLREQLDQAQSELNGKMQSSNYQSSRARPAQLGYVQGYGSQQQQQSYGSQQSSYGSQQQSYGQSYPESVAGSYVSSPREDSSSSLHSGHSTHFERDNHGFLTPISPSQSQFRRPDAYAQQMQQQQYQQQQQQLNMSHSRSFSSDVGVRGGGVFGGSETSGPRPESIKSDDSDGKSKKKNHKAQMMKSFVQF